MWKPSSLPTASERPIANGVSGSAADALVSPLSIVIPVYNEAKNLPELFSSLQITLEGLGIPSEIIFVDDGSQDNSLEVLLGLQKKDSRIIVVELTRNFGQHPALM